jgi:hypothetical protein
MSFPLTTTFAPASARAIAYALPSPFEEPVTIALFPSSNMFPPLLPSYESFEKVLLFASKYRIKSICVSTDKNHLCELTYSHVSTILYPHTNRFLFFKISAIHEEEEIYGHCRSYKNTKEYKKL